MLCTTASRLREIITLWGRAKKKRKKEKTKFHSTFERGERERLLPSVWWCMNEWLCHSITLHFTVHCYTFFHQKSISHFLLLSLEFSLCLSCVCEYTHKETATFYHWPYSRPIPYIARRMTPAYYRTLYCQLHPNKNYFTYLLICTPFDFLARYTIILHTNTRCTHLIKKTKNNYKTL